MSTLDEQIAAARNLTTEQTNAEKLAKNQELQSTLGALDTEQAEINPAYDALLRDTGTAFDTSLNTARESAASRGVFRGGILSNKELKLGTERATKISDIVGERTRKLADVAKRRSLAKTQNAQTVAQIERTGAASFGAESSKIRSNYEEQQYQRQQDALKLASSGSSKSTPEWVAKAQAKSELMSDISQYIKGGKWKQVAFDSERSFLPTLYQAYPELDQKDINNMFYSTRKSFE